MQKYKVQQVSISYSCTVEEREGRKERKGKVNYGMYSLLLIPEGQARDIWTAVEVFQKTHVQPFLHPGKAAFAQWRLR